ncbi:hypothetical protein BU23DRAFT_598048 [Bimuria novae-zelandiae CBS 107.79]|uniref:Uncharacterized protein n=1 Tax=Bimuria novae-zelandiae CBS 107.79 TaxID=1447943 RepID=A0A6A5VMU7_9PLEO|nr:hypothetical protein BU23DRAFT_598048 [Bimuria novae-zelandiae CBS 107.79]
MTYATAQFYAGTKDGAPAFLDYASGQSNLLPPEKHKIQLHDIHKLSSQPSLQTRGFQHAQFISTIREQDFISDQAGPSTTDAVQTYYAECSDLVRRLTGAVEVVPFHHRYRQQKAPPAVGAEKVKLYTTTPVPDIHIDNDSSTASSHLYRVLPTSVAAHWSSRHWAIINVWRPLAPVHQMPLALLDPSSIPIHPTPLAEPVYTRSNYKSHIRGLKWHPKYKFYYISEMQPEEALAFVDYDSERRWRMGGVAHGAVQEVCTSNAEELPLRSSVDGMVPW